MKSVWVIGMGPGHLDYVTPAALNKARSCQVLVGVDRYLALFADSQADKITLSGDLQTLLTGLRQTRGDRQIGFLVTGDPGMYSLLPMVKDIFGAEATGAVPGISSVSYLAACAGRSWQDCEVISLHGRDALDGLTRKTGNRRNIAVLTDPGHPPQAVAAALLQAGWENHTVIIGSRLSWPDETIIETDLTSAAGMSLDGMSVMIIEG